MVTDLVRVFDVTSQETTAPELRLFVITTNKVTRPDICLQFETVNAYAASLCQRAKQMKRSIVVTWERSKYGKTLTAAHFLKEKGSA